MVRKLTLSILGAAALTIAGHALAAPGMASNGVLVGDKGMTLYTFDKDAANSGKSVCNGKCAAAWPPFMAPAGAKAEGAWTVITRDDGAKQWAYKGMPVYYWVKDKAAGDKTGDGVAGVWHIIKP
ncbi:MAG: COG4315 family predicted lipoprotein [Bordetella sp.]|uniref:COG4315 family predicted lipoprotein n=1 Tax=Bordetella sp. TaxID=28081 RepID=UPI003F7B4FC1